MISARSAIVEFPIALSVSEPLPVLSLAESEGKTVAFLEEYSSTTRPDVYRRFFNREDPTQWHLTGSARGKRWKKLELRKALARPGFSPTLPAYAPVVSPPPMTDEQLATDAEEDYFDAAPTVPEDVSPLSTPKRRENAPEQEEKQTEMEERNESDSSIDFGVDDFLAREVGKPPLSKKRYTPKKTKKRIGTSTPLSETTKKTTKPYASSSLRARKLVRASSAKRTPPLRRFKSAKKRVETSAPAPVSAVADQRFPPSSEIASEIPPETSSPFAEIDASHPPRPNTPIPMQSDAPLRSPETFSPLGSVDDRDETPTSRSLLRDALRAYLKRSRRDHERCTELLAKTSDVDQVEWLAEKKRELRRAHDAALDLFHIA